MIVNVGDQVEVDTPGMAFHGFWGTVREVGNDGAVWVDLAEHTKITGTRMPVAFPLRFNVWELRALRRAV